MRRTDWVRKSEWLWVSTIGRTHTLEVWDSGDHRLAWKWRLVYCGREAGTGSGYPTRGKAMRSVVRHAAKYLADPPLAGVL